MFFQSQNMLARSNYQSPGTAGSSHRCRHPNQDQRAFARPQPQARSVRLWFVLLKVPEDIHHSSRMWLHTLDTFPVEYY